MKILTIEILDSKTNRKLAIYFGRERDIYTLKMTCVSTDGVTLSRKHRRLDRLVLVAIS